MVGTKIVPSKSAARRAITEGGAYLNNRKVTDVDAVPTAEDLLHGRFLILRRGKRTVGAVEVISGDLQPLTDSCAGMRGCESKTAVYGAMVMACDGKISAPIRQARLRCYGPIVLAASVRTLRYR